MDSIYNFLESNSIYIVLFIALTIWLGVFLFLYSTDKRLKNIEKELKESKADEQ